VDGEEMTTKNGALHHFFSSRYLLFVTDFIPCTCDVTYTRRSWVLEVRRLRLARAWNQTELAYHAGLAPSVISQIENGKRDPTARTLRKLAEALEVEVGDLFPKEQAPLPNFEQRRETTARGAALERYKSLRNRLVDIEELGRHEQHAVFDESLRLFKDLLLNDLHKVLTDAERREQNLVMDVLQQATKHILAVWELEQERGDPGAEVIDIQAYKARLRGIA
jgi:transcriptional regulator with XRE-family HTH domain